ncbi:hypothetical protein ANN_01123 [Periplaneta americana]|uniref:Uncharacterized protein n=1 Tax=Periplaneta americana TaxID=6978 RepID=A0ABQ8TW19_PERAM|nr:hypothetical protein ANN_01123 [Periplaneta americana]
MYQHYFGASEAACCDRVFNSRKCAPIDIHRRLKSVYRDQCVDISTVRRWSAHARNEPGATLNLCDKGRSRIPRTATDNAHRNHVNELITGNRRITQEHLSIQYGDETWVGLHHFDFEDKRSSMQFCHKESPATKKFKVLSSASKLMLSLLGYKPKSGDVREMCSSHATLWLSNMVSERETETDGKSMPEENGAKNNASDAKRPNPQCGPRKNTGMKDVVQVADELKWNWGGHVARKRDTQWTYRVTMWDPRIGKRSAGRQRTIWADIFAQRAGKQWKRRARNRSTWKKLSKEKSIELKKENEGEEKNKSKSCKLKEGDAEWNVEEKEEMEVSRRWEKKESHWRSSAD